ncbi:MAG: hypothetical protein ACRD2G_17770, partial [Terriglobia bacterium]
NVTAPSIIGNIEVSSGPISGTIQTTGLRLDAITGESSTIAADWGRVYSQPASKEKGGESSGTTVLAATVVYSGGGGLSGRLISRGNMISQVVANGGISGVIAAQGDLGVNESGTRLGGIVSNGPVSGQVVVLGKAQGDLTLHGGLKGGALAFAGDVLGNLDVEGQVDSASKIIAMGSIGSAAAGTTMSGSVSGILAAAGTINAGRPFNTRSALFYQAGIAAGTANWTAMEAIFTNGGQSLAFDGTSLGDLQGLNLILTDLTAIHVGSNKALLGATP